MEATYELVHEQLREGLESLKNECREATKQQEALIRSDMDQIINSQTFLETKLQGIWADSHRADVTPNFWLIIITPKKHINTMYFKWKHTLGEIISLLYYLSIWLNNILLYMLLIFFDAMNNMFKTNLVSGNYITILWYE